MQTTEALRRKIHTAEDLYSIVRTMKTLAAVNIRHYEKVVEYISEYYQTIEQGLQVVLQKGPIEILKKSVSEVGGLGAIVFGSDQGLCGGFNDQIVSHALKEMYEREDTQGQTIVMCVGYRASTLLGERGYSIDKTFLVPGSLAGVTVMVQQIVMAINDWQAKGKASKVVLFHNKLLSSVSYKPHTVYLLPLDREWFQTMVQKKWPSHVLPTFAMNRNRLFSALIRQHFFVSLYRAFAESMASENAGRLASMQVAERNIEERLEELNTLYRHERQSSITDELLDIMSGFEALRSSEEFIHEQRD